MRLNANAAAPHRPSGSCGTARELGDLLNVYGRQVAAGQWRDYAMADGRETAGLIFSAKAAKCRFTGLKNSRPAKKQGQYVLRGMDARVLRRGHDLAALLRFFDKKTCILLSKEKPR